MGERKTDGFEIRRWVTSCRVPGRWPELSDTAAVLIAAGYLGDDARAVVVARARQGLPLPRVGGYAALRRDFAELRLAEREATKTGSKLFGGLLNNRIMTLRRRCEGARADVVHRRSGFATNGRAIKRERRDGIHLEQADRERLFEGLLYTPTPNLSDASMGERLAARAAGRLTKPLQTLARGGDTVERVANWVSDVAGRDGRAADDRGDSVFRDGYETLLFLAGAVTDEIVGSAAWNSEHFEVQRGQMDLAFELAGIATDAVSLRSLRIQLDGVLSGAPDADPAHLEVRRREAELLPVWQQLLERVEALGAIAENVRRADAALWSVNRVGAAEGVDPQIDALIGRAGLREMGTEQARQLADDVRAGEERIHTYRRVRDGNFTAVDIPQTER